ncbi:30S ribosomal protein S1 [Neorhodopirellula pilleata]|uniref:30S ribosomal protein S1 n=1 Tax=Neorhodopirellula pilleata TaxID=2714738 RepID=A0A5C6A330_9BACT|nr:S1 RNA-binding domain-containing protein [Neorhodopirellula pilleata]TWT93658.1 30S ribosomal protein S1 [Neorhodopirellula pilleata]
MSVTENSESNPPTAPAADSSNTKPEAVSSSDPAASTVPAAQAETAPTRAESTQPSAQTSGPKKSKAPLPRIGGARMGAGPLASRGLGVAKPVSPAAVSTEDLEKAEAKKSKSGGKSAGKKAPRPRLAGEKDADVTRETANATAAAKRPGKVAVPNIREDLSDDLMAELEATLAGSDVDNYLSSGAGLPDRREPLAEGARVQAKVLKIKEDIVFIALGGPDEGTVPFEQFTEAEPAPGDWVEVLIRGFSREDGLYSCTLPGSAIEVSDWDDIEEGSVVEATVTGHNTGGLECKIGSIQGFMPISQVTEYRVEDLSEFVDQKMVCLVTEANARRGNLVVSRRAILEREREGKRKEQLEKMEPGDIIEGTVRSVRDFGAFVDLGGLDGLIHVSKLSWERVKHPSEVIQEGQKVKVRVDTIDKQTGKIGLSYRDLLENPWDTAENEFAVGSVHTGTVTRIAAFGCFVRLTAGVEGLVHISELANHRVSKVDSLVSEGDSVEVKVLSFDRDSQKVALSMKAVHAKPVETEAAEEEADDQPAPEVSIQPQHTGPLKGGNDRATGGERFGLRW